MFCGKKKKKKKKKILVIIKLNKFIFNIKIAYHYIYLLIEY
jgi:hypothetical protein